MVASELSEFSKECAGSEEYSTIVPFLSLELFKYIYLNNRKDFSPKEYMSLFHELEPVLKKYLQHKKENKVGVFNDNRRVESFYFSMAYLFEKYDICRELYAKHGDKLNTSALKNLGIDFKPAAGLIHAIEPMNATMIRNIRMELDWSYGFIESLQLKQEKINELKELLKQSQVYAKHELSHLFFDKYNSLIDNIERFYKGEWLNLDFKNHPSLWKISNGQFKTMDSKSILGMNQSRGQGQYLITNLRLPPPYQIEVEVEDVFAYGRFRSLPSGIIVGRVVSDDTGRVFWSENKSGRTGIGVPKKDLTYYTLKRGTTKTLKVNAWEGRYEFFVDNEEVSIANDPKFKPYRFGLGTLPWLVVSGAAKYKNVRIKKIDAALPPEFHNYEAYYKYYENRLKEEQNENFYLNAGLGRINAEDYLEAYEHLQKSIKIKKHLSSLRIFGMLNRWFGKYKESLKYLNEAKAMSKQYSKDHQDRVLLEIAILHAACPDKSYLNPEKALKITRRIRNKRRYEKLINKVQAFAHGSLGNFDKAIKHLERTLNLEKTEKVKVELKEILKVLKEKKPYKLETVSGL